jgi:hypothetical protein
MDPLSSPPPVVATEEMTQAQKNQAKITQRMIKIRELIQTGEYPDRDELAERLVDKL